MEVTEVIKDLHLTFMPCWWNFKGDKPFLEAVCQFIMLDVHLPYDPEILLLDIYTQGKFEEMSPSPQKRFVQEFS